VLPILFTVVNNNVQHCYTRIGFNNIVDNWKERGSQAWWEATTLFNFVIVILSFTKLTSLSDVIMHIVACTTESHVPFGVVITGFTGCTAGVTGFTGCTAGVTGFIADGVEAKESKRMFLINTKI
jgi:hypothetical protein